MGVVLQRASGSCTVWNDLLNTVERGGAPINSTLSACLNAHLIDRMSPDGSGHELAHALRKWYGGCCSNTSIALGAAAPPAPAAPIPMDYSIFDFTPEAMAAEKRARAGTPEALAAERRARAAADRG